MLYGIKNDEHGDYYMIEGKEYSRNNYHVYIRVEEDMCAYGIEKELVFDNKQDCISKVNKLNSLQASFTYKPYYKWKKLEETYDLLMKCQKETDKLFEGYEDYKGISFTDVGAGLQIAIHTTKVSTGSLMNQLIIKDDEYDKLGTAPQALLEIYRQSTTDESIKFQDNFMEDIRK